LSVTAKHTGEDGNEYRVKYTFYGDFRLEYGWGYDDFDMTPVIALPTIRSETVFDSLGTFGESLKYFVDRTIDPWSSWSNTTYTISHTLNAFGGIGAGINTVRLPNLAGASKGWFFGGSTVTKGSGLLKFGADDLVYGPSAGGALRGLQQRAGGRLLTDFSKPLGSSWADFSITTLNKQVQSGGKVRFDLTNVSDLKGVLSNRGSFANTVTAKELRHIQSNWSQFKGSTTFYRNGQEVAAPW